MGTVTALPRRHDGDDPVPPGGIALEVPATAVSAPAPVTHLAARRPSTGHLGASDEAVAA